MTYSSESQESDKSQDVEPVETESVEDVKKRISKAIDALDLDKLGVIKARSRGGSSVIVWSLSLWDR